MGDGLRTRRVAVSSIGVGPQINWPCLAALAARDAEMAGRLLREHVEQGYRRMLAEPAT